MSRFNKIILWINYALILSLLLGIFAKYIPPVLFWFPAFFGLAFPFLLILNLLFIIYWLFQFKHVFVFGLLAVALSFPGIFRYIQFSSESHINDSKLIKVTSYNSMLFDLYNWGKDKETRQHIMNTLTELDPDVLCLQEFYTSEEKGDYNNADTVTRLLNLPYYHAEFTETLRKYDHWGIATFSKFPIVNKGKIIFNTRNNNICIFTDLLINKDTIRVYNIHLQSIGFNKSDNKFLEEVVSDKEANDELEHSKNILRRLKRAFVKRAKQVQMITAHMKTCRYKIVLCGDFNDTAASYAYETLSKSLKDSFLEKGNGLGVTYAGKWPQFRIDYILHDPQLKCRKFVRSKETYTDHYPITAFFQQ